MTVTDDLLRNNAEFAKSFSKGDLPMPPGKALAVVACMDARLNVYALLGLEEGGPRHPQRRRRGQRRRAPLAGHLPAPARHPEVILVHHTDCGMLTFTDDQVKADIEADVGLRPHSPPRPSPTWSATSASRSPASRPARSSSTRTPSAASSTTSPPASSRRSPEHRRASGVTTAQPPGAEGQHDGDVEAEHAEPAPGRERRRVGPHGGDGHAGRHRQVRVDAVRPGGGQEAGQELGANSTPNSPATAPAVLRSSAQAQPEQADGAEVERAPSTALATPGWLGMSSPRPRGSTGRPGRPPGSRAGTGGPWSARARRPCPTAPAAAAGPRRG